MILNCKECLHAQSFKKLYLQLLLENMHMRELILGVPEEPGENKEFFKHCKKLNGKKQPHP